MSEQAQFETLIGPSRTGYYMSYFERAEARGYPPASWHWPAFFLGVIWLLYRKQYTWALIVIGAHFVIALVTSAVALLGMPELTNPLYLTFMFAFQGVYIPLNANGIYYRWAKAKIAQARESFPGEPDSQDTYLRLQGGTNRHLPLIIVVILILLMSLGTPPTPA